MKWKERRRILPFHLIITRNEVKQRIHVYKYSSERVEPVNHMFVCLERDHQLEHFQNIHIWLIVLLNRSENNFCFLHEKLLSFYKNRWSLWKSFINEKFQRKCEIEYGESFRAQWNRHMNDVCRQILFLIHSHIGKMGRCL